MIYMDNAATTRLSSRALEAMMPYLTEQYANPAGTYRLFRIGDAVAARNTHAAIYDALRLAKDI